LAPVLGEEQNADVVTDNRGLEHHSPPQDKPGERPVLVEQRNDEHRVVLAE
jgi:hypothetical protein